MYAGIAFTENNIFWGTTQYGRFFHFPITAPHESLSAALKDTQKAQRLVQTVVSEIEQKSNEKLQICCIAYPGLSIREYVMLENAWRSTGIKFYLMDASIAAIVSHFCSQPQDRCIRATAIIPDENTYRMTMATCGDCVIEVIGTAEESLHSLDVHTAQQAYHRLSKMANDSSYIPQEEVLLLPANAPAQLHACFRENIRLHTVTTESEALVYGAWVKAGIWAGDVKDLLVMDTTKYEITVNSIPVIERDTSTPTQKVTDLPSLSTQKSKNVTICIKKNDKPEESLSFTVPLFHALKSDRHYACTVNVTYENKYNVTIEDDSPERMAVLSLKWEDLCTGILAQSPAPSHDAALVPDDSSPFIFISYAHKNSDSIRPLIRKMQQDGFTVWFDDNILPGSEWSEEIATHIEQCTLFAAFITPEYMASENCKKELHFAGDQNINRTLICIGNVQLQAGMRLQHGLCHQISVPSLDDAEQMLHKLYTAKNIGLCRK
ncbi:MAG: TIR domain-containing protein [Clostridia bacterium]|nr:TIR domain-containing protein [Clostridia bacterium]